MTTLSDIRARIRQDLHDTESGAYLWPDAALDRHIARALDDVSRACPRELSSSIATTPGSRDLSLSGLAGLAEVEEVEFPAGEFPPLLVGFSRWANTLTLHTDAAPAGENAKVFYTAAHTLDGSGTTLPTLFEDLVCTGAGGYAALEWAVGAAARLNAGGPAVPGHYEAWARARLTAFRQLLMHHARADRVRARRLYLPA